MSYNHKQVINEYITIASRFDLDDWRTVRNEDYWDSDKLSSPVERLNYKMVRLRYYDKYGKVYKPGTYE